MSTFQPEEHRDANNGSSPVPEKWIPWVIVATGSGAHFRRVCHPGWNNSVTTGFTLHCRRQHPPLPSNWVVWIKLGLALLAVRSQAFARLIA